MSKAITDHSAANITCGRDAAGRALPASAADLDPASWAKTSRWSFANLMSGACESAAMLAEADADDRRRCGQFGLNVALALKAMAELAAFEAPAQVRKHGNKADSSNKF